MGEKDENVKIGIMVNGEFREINEIPSLEEEAERNYPEDGVEWFLHPKNDLGGEPYLKRKNYNSGKG